MKINKTLVCGCILLSLFLQNQSIASAKKEKPRVPSYVRMMTVDLEASVKRLPAPADAAEDRNPSIYYRRSDSQKQCRRLYHLCCFR